jgi:hypothetical protein
MEIDTEFSGNFVAKSVLRVAHRQISPFNLRKIGEICQKGVYLMM